MARWQELLSVLMDDQALPADTRLAIAQKSRSAAARSTRPRGKTTNPKSAARLSRKQAAVELDALFRLARNMSLAEEERRKAAMLIARLLLPTTPTGDPSWSRAVADEYGFVISAKIAPANIAMPNCCWRNSRTAMDRSDRETLGKPRRLGHASRRYAEVSYLLRTRSTEGTDLTDAASLLTRTSFRRI
jgi:hypothetical protein